MHFDQINNKFNLFIKNYIKKCNFNCLPLYSKSTFALFKDLYRDRRISNIQRRTSARWKLRQDHLESIKQFASNSNSTVVKKRRIVRLHLMRTFEDAPDVHINTIGYYMKENWRLPYKALESRHDYSYTSDNIMRFFESAAIQHQLRSKGVELIFFDEFSLNSLNMKHRGWILKWNKGYLEIDSNGFSMSFLVPLSDVRVYGIMGWSSSDDNNTVKHFVISLLSFRNQTPSITNSPFALVNDNASVDIWDRMVKFYKISNFSIISIAPYFPRLNISEISSVRLKEI